MVCLKAAVLGLLVTTTIALPPSPRRTERQLGSYKLSKRQNSSTTALPNGFGDLDILQFALTLEHLESSFYQQALVAFPDAQALGLTEIQFADMQKIAFTESEHVSTLESALAQAGISPVRSCTYDFSAALASPSSLIATAAILENVGVSAYLGAAGLLSDVQLLGVAGSILTIEARHQTAIRVFGGSGAIVQAFDASLGLRAVFSLAAPFIKQCPDGSNLILEAFPTLTLVDGQGDVAALAASGVKIQLTSDAAHTATHCAFTAGGVSAGGTVFSTFAEGDGCAVPHEVGGVSYLTLVNNAPLDGILTDEITVAGPIAVTIS